MTPLSKAHETPVLAQKSLLAYDITWWRHRSQKGQKSSKIVFFVLFRHFLHQKVPLRPLYLKLTENTFWPKSHFWPMTSHDDVIGLKRVENRTFLSFLVTFCMKREKVPLQGLSHKNHKTKSWPKILFTSFKKRLESKFLSRPPSGGTLE